MSDAPATSPPHLPSLDAPPPPRPVLHVCVTCLAGQAAEAGPRPGRVLHDRLAGLLARPDAPAVTLHPAECLAVCLQGCSASIALPGKWSYLLGRLAPEKAEDLLVFAEAYGRSRTGTVMPSRRPASLSDMILGRIPGSGQDVPG